MFLMDYGEALNRNTLTGQDWDLLGKTHSFLQPFASATLYAEGAVGSLSEWLEIMDALLLHYENNKVGTIPY